MYYHLTAQIAIITTFSSAQKDTLCQKLDKFTVIGDTSPCRAIEVILSAYTVYKAVNISPTSCV